MSKIVWTVEKKSLMVGNTFFHVSRGHSEIKNFTNIFFQNSFRTLREKFPDLWGTFDWQGLQNSFFFCQGNFVTQNIFFQVNEMTIKKFSPPTVSFLDFWRKRLSGIVEFNSSCPDELFEKNHLFHKFSYFHESFRTLGEKCSKLCPTLFGRAIEKATYMSRGTLWRKTKCFKCFK